MNATVIGGPWPALPYEEWKDTFATLRADLTRIAPLLNERRATFIGKSSPVHVSWGAFDLAVTRFSRRPARLRDEAAFMREAYTDGTAPHSNSELPSCVR